MSPRGWQERCRIEIVREANRSASESLILRGGGSGSIVLLTRRLPFEIRYLLGPTAALAWLTSWESSTALPLAIALVSMRDTIIVPFGDRG